MAALLPDGLFPLLTLGGIVVGLLLVLRRGVPKAYGLGMIMMVAFLIDTLARFQGASTQGELGFVVDRLLRGEGWWTPLTSAFIHAPPARGGSFFNLHLFGNLFILLTAGPALEERVGEKRFLLIFFAAHAAALVSHAVLGIPQIGILTFSQLALGASGGIFGVLTAFAVRYPRERLPMLLIFFVFWMQASIVLLLYLGFNVAYFAGDFLSGSPSGIGWWGHFAGFFVGLAWAFRLPEAPAAVERAGSTKGLPDAEKLAPLATTPQLKRILERVRQFTPDARTAHDSTFALEWVDKFLEHATCEQGHSFTRNGLKATCSGGETSVDFAR